MKVNQKIKLPLAWLWSIDVYFYSIACPVIYCIVNKQLNVALYAVPNLILCLFGGIVNLRITERDTMKLLYDKWFLQITLLDAFVWIGYFTAWLFDAVPDTWYPVSSAIMSVSTVQLSRAVRSELENRLFPNSDEKTEFDNACKILCDLFNAAGCVTILLLSLKSFFVAKLVLLFAMVVDNAVFVAIWMHTKKNENNES